MQFLENLFSSQNSNPAQTGLVQAEREAVIDLLLWATYAENHLSFSETKVLNAMTESLGWDSVTATSVYISSATNRARLACSDVEKQAEFLEAIVARLTTAEARAHSLELLNQLFEADGTTVKEAAFYQQVEAAFAG